MLPSTALTHEFTARVRARGDHYVGAETVDIISGSTNEVAALVQGSDSYAVLIGRTREGSDVRFDVSCTCPFFIDNYEPCKHIWATLKVGERSGHLIDPKGPALTEQNAYLEMAEPLEEDLEATTPPVSRGEWRRRVQATRAGRAPARAIPPPPSPSQVLLSRIQSQLSLREAPPTSPFPYLDTPLLYVLDAPASATQGLTVLHVMYQRRTKAGREGAPKMAKLSADDIAHAPQADRRILALLSGASRRDAYMYGYSYGVGAGAGAYYRGVSAPASFLLPAPLAIEVLPAIARGARAWFKPTADAAILPLPWDDGPAWRFRLRTTEHATGYRLDGEFARHDATMPMSEPYLILSGAFIVLRGTLALYEETAADVFLAHLRTTGPVDVSASERAVLAQLLARSGAPPEAVPATLRLTEVSTTPTPRLSIDQASNPIRPWLPATLSFDYDGSLVSGPIAGQTAFDAERQRVVRRDAATERAAASRLSELGLRQGWPAQGPALEIATRQFAGITRTLLAEGWHIEADGRRYRASTSVRLAVASGIDWFDLTGAVEFGDLGVSLSDALAALTSGRTAVRLGDGTVGLLPEDWLARYAPLASVGEFEGERVRFTRPQAALLDALLAGREHEAAITVDETFARVRRELAGFDRVRPLAPPASFKGTLRPYQREGLGWFAFLRQFGFGGCLADDMGLGKTIMVLALLEQRRLEAGHAATIARPSLIVVPRSLIANWMAEAARFTPKLRILDHSHAARDANVTVAVAAHDVVLVTYGTMRRDITTLATVEFDYVVLDEAQAIKNASTASARAARLLSGRHRLALSGTPIENHLGELWSLFEFLNPGVLGRSSVFQRATSMVSAGADPEMTQVVARGLRPFILRRTKQQVAHDLPARTEQTIVCELSVKERALYDGLRPHYRDSVLDRINRVGLAKSKMHVLEALLRLRQASCHPGLIHPAQRSEGSAKFDVLVPRLREVVAEGHKALVFSQFTTLLGLLRGDLEAAGVAFEYLDGKTRDRGERVQHFQEDPKIGVFLISLKAGGLGLNLTAAEYVFLLDPWWNPAVEAQAIDRAHRIGQSHEVFAYRLIAKDTIEEKVLELQASKRALADAVLSADRVGLRKMGREDLELLLS